MAKVKPLGPKLRRPRFRLHPTPKKVIGRDWPLADSSGSIWNGCRAVCKRCHYAMTDIEPMSGNGEFWHPSKDRDGKTINCSNAGGMFHRNDAEVEPFLRKRDRRRNKRNNVRP